MHPHPHTHPPCGSIGVEVGPGREDEEVMVLYRSEVDKAAELDGEKATLATGTTILGKGAF